MTPVAARMLSCLERQRAHFGWMIHTLDEFDTASDDTIDAGLRRQDRSAARTRALEDEFNTVLRDWENADVPASDREQVRTVAALVANDIEVLEARIRVLASKTDAAKDRVRGELKSLERGRGIMRKFGTTVAPEPGYIDRRA